MRLAVGYLCLTLKNTANGGSPAVGADALGASNAAGEPFEWRYGKKLLE
jgi:hypothetical protein